MTTSKSYTRFVTAVGAVGFMASPPDHGDAETAENARKDLSEYNEHTEKMVSDHTEEHPSIEYSQQIERCGRESRKTWEPHPRSAAQRDFASWLAPSALQRSTVT